VVGLAPELVEQVGGLIGALVQGGEIDGALAEDESRLIRASLGVNGEEIDVGHETIVGPATWSGLDLPLAWPPARCKPCSTPTQASTRSAPRCPRSRRDIESTHPASASCSKPPSDAG